MMLNRTGCKALGAIALVALAAGCASSTADTAAGGPAAAAGAATPEMIAEGRTLFSGSGQCAVCHGQGGRGGRSGPNLTDDEWIWVNPAQPVRPQVAGIIRNGVPNPREASVPMPAMGGGSLSDAQINALAAYVESL